MIHDLNTYDEDTDDRDVQMIARLGEAAESALDDFGLPPELRDGSVHCFGSHCSSGRIYVLQRESGTWHCIDIETPKAMPAAGVFEIEIPTGAFAWMLNTGSEMSRRMRAEFPVICEQVLRAS